MTVSIIIPVKPGGEVRALDSLRCLECPQVDFELLIAEGSCPSRQRNQAARQAEGDILYFLDDDSLVSPGFLQQALIHFADPSVAVVGGPSLTPATDSLRQRAFGAAFASPFGGGGVRSRYMRVGKARRTDDSGLILCNLAFRRRIFLDKGGFDERLYPNEENELMERIGDSGLAMVHDPDLAVMRSQRPTFRAFVRQMLNYGRGRGQQTRISGKVRWSAFAPALFLVYLAILPCFAGPVFSLPLLAYILLTIIFAIQGGIASRNPLLGGMLLLVLPMLHLCYGAGIFRGLLGKLPTSAPAGASVNIRHLKKFGAPWIDCTAKSRGVS